MNNIKAILFDLDGTLIDSAQNFYTILQNFRDQHQLPALRFEDVRSATTQGLKALISLGWNTQENDPHFHDYKKQFLQAYKKYIAENPIIFFSGIENILLFLHQQAIPWGIVTNKHAQFTRAIAEQHPILNAAHTLVSGDTVEHSKPHPAPLLYACNQLLISPEYCLFIGDHQKDIIAGKSAGTQTGVALYGYLSATDQVETWGANYLFKNPEDIEYWLNKRWPH